MLFARDECGLAGVRRNDGNVNAVSSEVVDEHQRGPGHAIDRAEGLGA